MSVRNNAQTGFTLIELAIVLVIIGILVGSFIGTLTVRIENTKIKDTEKELAEIKQALLAYAFTQSPPRLPCPDVTVPPDGIEDACAATTFGTLPWRDLGLGEADIWNTRYRYWVQENFSALAGFDLSTTLNVPGEIDKESVAVVLNAVAVILSHGKNGLGGVSVNGINRGVIPAAGHAYELENADGNNKFEAGPRTSIDSGAGEFDDILTWITEFELKAKMVEAGVLP